VRGQNIHRCALAFLVLVPDLSGQIDDRNNDSDSAQHLPDGADHLPVHTCWLMNDGTNPQQQKRSAVQSDHRTESVREGFEPSEGIIKIAHRNPPRLSDFNEHRCTSANVMTNVMTSSVLIPP